MLGVGGFKAYLGDVFVGYLWVSMCFLLSFLEKWTKSTNMGKSHVPCLGEERLAHA